MENIALIALRRARELFYALHLIAAIVSLGLVTGHPR
jgi:hypothetical protein